MLFASRPRFTPLCLLLFSDLLLITQPKRWVPGREGAQPGEGAVDGLGGIYEHSPSLNTPFTEKQSIVC